MYFTKTRVLNYFTPGLRLPSNQIPLRFDPYSGCSNSCRYCGIKGVEISTPNGTKTIESLKINDEILSVNIKTNHIEDSIVSDVMNRKADDIYTIQTTSSKIKGITGEHPIWTKRGWIPVNKLTEGDSVLVE